MFKRTCEIILSNACTYTTNIFVATFARHFTNNQATQYYYVINQTWVRQSNVLCQHQIAWQDYSIEEIQAWIKQYYFRKRTRQHH